LDGADDFFDSGGSGVMMLTAGIESADGKNSSREGVLPVPPGAGGEDVAAAAGSGVAGGGIAGRVTAATASVPDGQLAA